jgi:predicted molibdopterin-dependent oxidoreductase YjgC
MPLWTGFAKVVPVTDTAHRSISRPLFHRLGGRGVSPVAFTIDGVPATAVAGDFLITAILTNRADLRHFEFSDATRAGFCLMGGCQDCWVGLQDGRRVRACTTPVEAGMAVVVDGGSA